MAEPPRGVLDVNVVLDVLQRREPWYRDSAATLAAAESGRLRAMLPGHAVTTLFYLYAKHASRDAARMRVAELLRFCDVAAIDRPVVATALTLPYGDLEDAVLMAAAERADADYVVTRDHALFAAGPVPVVTPGELLALLGDPSG